MKIIKRDGSEETFDSKKIEKAISKASDASIIYHISDKEIKDISLDITRKCEVLSRPASVEEIQDMVEDELAERGYVKLMREYSKYRTNRTLRRRANTTDAKILSLIEITNEEVLEENANKNPELNSTQRDYVAGEISKDISKRYILPQDVVEAHDNGEIHVHDLDYLFQRSKNCCLVNLKDMFDNGTVISGTLIERPHSFATACNIATQIIAQVASGQYGGQTISLSHLVPFVDISRNKIRKELLEDFNSNEINASNEKIETIVETRLKREIERGVQTIQYQVITLMTTNGQAPFVTIFMYLDEVDEDSRDDLAMIIEEVLKQRWQGVKNEKGEWITPAFPKLIYVLDEDNIYEDSKYYYLTKLAAKCTARRMVPDYISAKVMKKLKGDVYSCMGCRSFLTPDPINHKYYGRFNQGVCTINLVDAACSSNKDEDKFWKIMDERTNLCYKALMCKHNRLKGTPSDVSPIHWQYGALSRLKKGEVIDKLLYDNYSTISLGYAGLYECTMYMKGVSHTNPIGKEFALKVMKYLNDRCRKWREVTNISFSLYGTPMESVTYKFASSLQRRFGIIKDITDKNYITNSYHIHVTEPINAFDKLSFEAEFQELSPGGAISYVEVPNLQNNLDAVLVIIKYIYENIMYAELNCKSDYCQNCGYDGEIEIIDSDGKLIWKCPSCGNTDMRKMNIARRVCGYISSNVFNQGRTQEIKERVLHLSLDSNYLED